MLCCQAQFSSVPVPVRTEFSLYSDFYTHPTNPSESIFILCHSSLKFYVRPHLTKLTTTQHNFTPPKKLSTQYFFSTQRVFLTPKSLWPRNVFNQKHFFDPTKLLNQRKFLNQKTSNQNIFSLSPSELVTAQSQHV